MSPKKKVKKMDSFRGKKLLSKVPMPLLLPLGKFLGGLILAYFGTQALSGPLPNWSFGLPLQIAAAFLLITAIPKRAQVPADPKGNSKPAGGPMPENMTPGVLWFGLLAFLALSQLVFHFGDPSGAWTFAVVAAGWAFWIFRKKNVWGSKPLQFHVHEKAWFWGVMLFAAALRLTFVGSNLLGLQGDEAEGLDDALAAVRGVLLKSPFVTGWGGTPTLTDYYVAAFFKVFGEHVWVGRLASAIASVAGIWFFYRWVRFWCQPMVALLATFCLAGSWWSFYFSQSPFPISLLLLEEMAAFYFMEKAFREGKRADFWWTGILSASCVMNYVAGRGVPAMMFLTVAGYILLRRGPFLKAYWRQMCLAVAAFFWFLTPFLLHALQYPGEVWGRVNPDQVALNIHQPAAISFILRSYFWTVTNLWGPNPQVDYRFALPTMSFQDGWIGAFAVLGLGLCLLSPLRTVSWVLIPGFFIGISSNALSLLGLMANPGYVHSNRFSTVMPFLYLGAALGAEWLLRIYKTLFPKAKAKWVPWAFGALAAASVSVNVPLFAPQFHGSQGSWGEHGFPQIEAADILLKNAPECHLLVDSAAISATVYFLIHDKAEFHNLYYQQDIPVRYEVKKDVLFLFPPWRIEESQKADIHRLYPGAVWTEYKNPWNTPFLQSVRIPLKEILAEQKGRTPKGPLS